MGALAVGLAYGAPSAVFAGARVHSKRVISMQPRLYHGWPTLARRRNGELLLVCSGGRESHVCPFGRVELMRSRDEGRHWSFPRVLIDGPIDDRDAGVVETAEGSLLVTTFTSIGYADILARAEELESQGKPHWTREKLERWQAIHRRITAAEREIELGSWMIRSTDGGRSWSAPYRCPVNSPHGPIQLSDGRLLYPGKIFWYGPSGQSKGRIGVCESTDDGQSWRWLAEIPTREGDDLDIREVAGAVAGVDHAFQRAEAADAVPSCEPPPRAVHDPAAMENARTVLGDSVDYFESYYDDCRGADALVLHTEWSQYRQPTFEMIKELMKTPVIFDGRTIYDHMKLEAMGIKYFGIGR